MASFMGRAGAGGGVASRALDPIRSRLRPQGSQRTYLSISNLRSLHVELVSLLYSAGATSAAPTSPSAHGPSLSARQSRRLVEILRSIAELVAFGEAAQKPEYFDFFCEKSTMALFVNALRLGLDIKTQVLQATSILFQNLRSPTSLYLLLSQGHINHLIQPAAGAAQLPMDDEEFLTNYVALLKMISVRLSKDTVHFFFNAGKGVFPLYERSVPLIGNPDPMVRTSALNIVLHVLSVQDPGVTAFLAIEKNHAGFFSQLSHLMQDAYSQILCRMWQVADPPVAESTAIDGATSFFQDMLYFVQDVLSVGGPQLSEKLASHLFRNFFRPVILEGLVEGSDSMMAAGTMLEEREPELQLALYALCQFFVLTTEGPLLGLVAAELFGEGGAAAAGAATAATANTDNRAYKSPGRVGMASTAACGHEAVGRSEAPDQNGGGDQNGGSDQGGGSGKDDGGDHSRNGGAVLGARDSSTARKMPMPMPMPMPMTTTTATAVTAGGAGEEKAGSTRLEANRYQRALLTCVSWRRQQGAAGFAAGAGGGGAGAGGEGEGGAQVRLGAIAVLRSAVKNPSAAAEIVLGESDRPVTSLDELARGLSPLAGDGAAAAVDGADCCGESGGPGRQGLIPAEAAAAAAADYEALSTDVDAGPSVLDFMLPGEERPPSLSASTLGSTGYGAPCVLDFMVPGCKSPPPAAATIASPPRGWESCLVAASGKIEEGKRLRGLKELRGGKDGLNDGFGPRPSKFLPRLERLWNGGALLFSERSGTIGSGGISGTSGASGSGGGRIGAAGSGSVSGEGTGGASSGGSGDGGGDDSRESLHGFEAAATGARRRSECFEQVMWRLLEALTDPPPADSVAVRTAAAAIEELCVLEVYSWGKSGVENNSSSSNSRSSGDDTNVRNRTHASVVGDPSIHALPRGGLWGPGTRNERFAAMLTEAYARSAESLLSTTTRLYPFALLAACEQAVELLGFGTFDPTSSGNSKKGGGSGSGRGSSGDFRVSSPHPSLADVAGSMLVLGDVGAAPGGNVGSNGRGGGSGGGGSRRNGLRAWGGAGGGAGGGGGELPALRVQNFLVLRSLHQWLVEGRTPLKGRASAAAAAAAAAAAPLDIPPSALTSESLGPLEILSLPGSVRVDAEFLGLVGAAAGGGGGDGDGVGDGQDDRAGVYSFPSAATAAAAVPKSAAGVGVARGPATAAAGDAPPAVPSKPPPSRGTAAGERLEADEARRVGGAARSTTSIVARIASWYNWGGGVTGRRDPAASVGPPRPGDRVRLSDKRCLACFLPFNWPGKPAAAAAAAVAPRSPANSGSYYRLGYGYGVAGWGGSLLLRGLLAGYAYLTTSTAAPALPPSNTASSSSSSTNSSNGTPNGGCSSPVSHGRRQQQQQQQQQQRQQYQRRRQVQRQLQEQQRQKEQGKQQQHQQQQRRQQDVSLTELYVIIDERSFLIAVPDPDDPFDGGLLVCAAPLRNTAAKRHPANPRVLELRVSTNEEARPGSPEEPGLFVPLPGGGGTAAGFGNGGGGACFLGEGHRGIWHLVLSFQNPGACRLVEESVEEQRGGDLALPTVGLVEMFRRVASMSSSSRKRSGTADAGSSRRRSGTADAGALVK